VNDPQDLIKLGYEKQPERPFFRIEHALAILAVLFFIYIAFVIYLNIYGS
jgi:hypothetical protein